MRAQRLLEEARAIIDAPPWDPASGEEIGRSVAGRPVAVARRGSGDLRVSLIAGCHADEPVGPRLLAHLISWLAAAPPEHPYRTRVDWWIVPHINPDGAARNRTWQAPEATEYDLAEYLLGAVREGPGADIEFGFPRGEGDDGARPETRAVARWWRRSPAPFALHASLHGMSFSGGPWWLFEHSWAPRCTSFMTILQECAAALGYPHLHDVERRGEKGFHRIAPGFASRPDSRAMAEHFRARGDPGTAELFRPSSMEAARALGADPFTLVTEMPLFILPEVGREIGPPDPAMERWTVQLTEWATRLASGSPARSVLDESRAAGVRPMPVRDQMILQWCAIGAAVAPLLGSA